MTSSEEFLQRIEAFLVAHKIGATTFGKKAMGDPNFVFDLREGRIASLAVFDRINAFMAEREAEKAA